MKKEIAVNESKFVSGGTGYKPDISLKKAGKIVLYPVTINELKELKSKSDGDIILNFFFGFVSAFMTCFISYLTCIFSSLYTELVFLFTSILFAILSIIAFLWWIRARKKTNQLYNEIINREDAS